MGTASKVCSMIFRCGELVSACIVAGLLGRYLYFLNVADGNASSRLIYTEVMAGISIILSIILLFPLKFTFYCFPLDFILFICWMVAFGLLYNVSYLILPAAYRVCCAFHPC